MRPAGVEKSNVEKSNASRLKLSTVNCGLMAAGEAAGAAGVVHRLGEGGRNEAGMCSETNRWLPHLCNKDSGVAGTGCPRPRGREMHLMVTDTASTGRPVLNYSCVEDVRRG